MRHVNVPCVASDDLRVLLHSENEVYEMGRSASIKTVQVDGEEEVGAKASGSQTLLRGLDVIDALIEGSLPLAELSEKLELTRSTTHRLASALVERRLLSFRPREGYSLGPKLLELGHAASQQMHLPRPRLDDARVRVPDRGDVVDHVEVHPTVDIDQVLAPAALDARR